jgi:hypothetical protein
MAEVSVEKVDLFNDWVAIAQQRLITAGFDVSGLVATPKRSLEDTVGLAYFNALLHLTIPVRPRQVYKAGAFTCPPDLLDGLQLFEGKVVAGESLRPHMSGSVVKLSNHDNMRYDWGIHHFHLGTSTKADGFVKRTGPLVFAWVTDEAVYLIDTMEHGVWTQQQILYAVYTNWPSLLEPYQVNATELTYHATDDDIATFRKAQINTILKIADGVFVLPPGGGFAASGHSSAVVDEFIHTRRQLLKLSTAIKNLSSSMVLNPIQEGWIQNPILSYSLIDVEGAKYAVRENNNGFDFVLEGTDTGLPPL